MLSPKAGEFKKVFFVASRKEKETTSVADVDVTAAATPHLSSNVVVYVLPAPAAATTSINQETSLYTDKL